MPTAAGEPETESRKLTWEMWKDLGDQCKHFNTLESGYRGLASTWLLAAFGGIGFILDGSLPKQALLVSAVGAAAAIGIFLVWLLDIMVYHRLLAAVFSEQIRLEQEEAWLPQSAHKMMAAHEGRGVLRRVVWFYVMAFTIPVGIASVALGLALGLTPVALALGLGLFSTAGVGVAYYMYSASTVSTGEREAFERAKAHSSRPG